MLCVCTFLIYYASVFTWFQAQIGFFVLDVKQEPIANVCCVVDDNAYATTSNAFGYIELPIKQFFQISISHISYRPFLYTKLI